MSTERQSAYPGEAISRIFRQYNVCEFKSPDDALTIDDYFKTVTYAGLVKCSGHTVNEIPASEITVSLIRDAYPKGMIRELTIGGAVITEQYPGVYYVTRGPEGTGDVLFPTQIIVTGELDKTAHSGLRILTKNAEADDVRQFLREALSETEQGTRANVDAILQVSVSANWELYERIRREKAMCQALRELMKDEIRDEVKEGEQRGTILGAVAVYRDELGLDDQTIIDRISDKFNLSGEQATAYVMVR